jgi:Uma2 family endonuclease
MPQSFWTARCLSLQPNASCLDGYHKDVATSTSPNKVTFDEYLERERAATYKSEYRSGEIFAMSGGTPVHARLSARMVVLLDKLPGCQVFTSDLRVFAQAVNEGMYPDVSVSCEELQYHDGRKDVILNPTLVVEVLSPATREYDIGMKASFYRSIASVAGVLLVDSERVYVQVQRRQSGSWMLEEFTREEQVVWKLGDFEMTVGQIYSGIVSFM